MTPILWAAALIFTIALVVAVVSEIRLQHRRRITRRANTWGRW